MTIYIYLLTYRFTWSTGEHKQRPPRHSAQGTCSVYWVRRTTPWESTDCRFASTKCSDTWEHLFVFSFAFKQNYFRLYQVLWHMRTYFVVVEKNCLYCKTQIQAYLQLHEHNHKPQNTNSKCPDTISQSHSYKKANTHSCSGKKIQTHRQRNTNRQAKKYKVTHKEI